MKKYLRCLVLALVVVVNTACAGLLVPKEDRLLPAGRFSELAGLMEERIENLHTAGTSQLMYLCYAYSRLKRYNKLFPCLDQIERNIEKDDRTVFLIWDGSAMPHFLRAEALLDFGNYGEAVQQAQKAYDIVLKRDLHRYMRIHALSALALSQALKGNHHAAEDAAKLLEGIGTHYPFTFLTTDKLMGLARTYMALGDFRKSLAIIQEDENISGWRAVAQAATLAIMAISPGDDLFAYQQLPKVFILTKSLYETGQVKEAKAGYDQLLKNARTQDNGDIYWMILFDRGRIAEGEGNRQEAIEFYRRAIEVIEKQRSTINTEASKIGFAGDKQAVYHLLVAALVADGQHAAAFEYVERSKSRALVDLLASKRDFAVSGADQERVTSLLEELEIQEAEDRVQETSAPSDRRNLRTAQSLQMKQELRTVAPELASLVTVTRVATEDIQAFISKEETLVEYYFHAGDLYAFVLTGDSVTSARLDGSNLTEDIRLFRTALQDPRSQQYAELSRKLYERLIVPVAPLVTTSQVLIVAHGVLHYVPFAALHDGTNFLVDRYTTRHLPSASVIRYLKDRPLSTVRSLLAFGNPDLGRRQYDLKYAQDEAVSIAKEFPQARVLTRKEATKTAFKTLAPQFPYLHLATHGKFDPDTPLSSGLMLTDDVQGEGFLSLEELYSLRLKADLATLSACETGLGKVSNGDDVVGLTRGFLYAGANAIVASLWQVDDRSTASLMVEFYANLRIHNKSEALRQAQLATRQRYEHPFYWAAFQLTGRAD